MKNPGEGIDYPLQYSWATLVAQLLNSLPAIWETWFGRSPGEGQVYPLQYYGLENFMNSIIHRVTELDMTKRLCAFNTLKNICLVCFIM